MQRINLFPDPNMANTIFQCRPSRCTVDFPTVGGFRWLRATTSGSGDIYAQYQLTGANLPQAGVYHIHAACYARGSAAFFRVYAGVGNSFTLLHETSIADDQTRWIDADITIPANTTQLLIRVVPPSTVGKFILIRDILLESKSTYDTAVGGASGLLHRGHHATSVGATIGRVVSDDAHEHLSDTGYECYAQTRTQRYGFMQYADSGKRLLCEFLGHVFRPRHSENILWQRDHVHAERAVYRPVLSIDKHDENSNDSRVWLSNSPSDRLRGLRELRVRETSVGLPGHITLQRGYDATRLTPLGVMA